MSIIPHTIPTYQYIYKESSQPTFYPVIILLIIYKESSIVIHISKQSSTYGNANLK